MKFFGMKTDSEDTQGLQTRFLIFILVTIGIITIVVVLLTIACRKYNQKVVDFCENQKKQIFWNTIIRFAL